MPISSSVLLYCWLQVIYLEPVRIAVNGSFAADFSSRHFKCIAFALTKGERKEMKNKMKELNNFKQKYFSFHFLFFFFFPSLLKLPRRCQVSDQCIFPHGCFSETILKNTLWLHVVIGHLWLHQSCPVIAAMCKLHLSMVINRCK